MNIYVDFDDCLCETAEYFSASVREMFGVDVPYEKIKYFDLQKSFKLTDEQYKEIMEKGHTREVLLSYEETPGASETINKWISSGHNVSIITGRPCSSFEPSRQWLDEHGLNGAELFCLDKYGRDSFTKNSGFSLRLEDYYKMHFDFAVEDSPMAFKFLNHLPNLKVAVFDRPWNLDCEFPNENFHRCAGWKSIDAFMESGL